MTYAIKEFDKETGLYYLNARMYDPKIARFLQEDTYTGGPNDPLSLNLYTYCHNEPIMYTDPTGHEERDLIEMVNGANGNIVLEKEEWRVKVTVNDITKYYYLKDEKKTDINRIEIDTSRFIKDFDIKNIVYLYYEPKEDAKNEKYLYHMIRDKYNESETLILSNTLEGKEKFISDWNDMDDKTLKGISETIIHTHGSGDQIWVSSGDEAMQTHKSIPKNERKDGRVWASDFEALDEKYINNLVLASCLSGHLDWQLDSKNKDNNKNKNMPRNYNNVALEFLRQMNKNSIHVRRVTAWDSEVSFQRPAMNWDWLYSITPAKFKAVTLDDGDGYLNNNRPAATGKDPRRKPIGEVTYISNPKGNITVMDNGGKVVKKLDSNNNVVYENYKAALK